jgi:acyl-CoA synthetase (AMP-forming)/AMP-acid ligase II
MGDLLTARRGGVGDVAVTSGADALGQRRKANGRSVSALLDEPGSLRIVARVEDTSIVGGCNAYPAEIERRLAL